MKLIELPEFSKWIGGETAKSKAQIYVRLANIQNHNHFGDHKSVGDDVMELRWANGRRVYYALKKDNHGAITILILGGNKNGQDRDIKNAKKILKKSGW